MLAPLAKAWHPVRSAVGAWVRNTVVMKAKSKFAGIGQRETAAVEYSPSLPQTIAWQRVSLRAPQSWSMVAASGDERAGSVRVEQTGADDNAALLGMELRWSQIKSSQTAEMLERRIKPLLAMAEKTAKRLRIEAETNSVVVDDKRHPEREIVREFSWRADTAAIGRIWRCSECGRLLIAQVYSKAGSRYKDRAREMLAGLACHNAEIGWTRWALYGLDVCVPADYTLTAQQLMTIYVELRFTRGRGGKVGETLSVEQWSAANVQLKGAYLDDWLEHKGRSLQQSIAVEKAESSIHGHPALEMAGRRTGLMYWLGDASRSLASMQLPARQYSGIGWECPESNKVYLVQTIDVKRDGSTAREVAERIACHRSAEIISEPACP
jgi:hypothetical protein